MTPSRRSVLFVLCLAPPVLATAEAPQAAAAPGVDVTYLGNEGFLIAAGDTMVLVDALFADGIEGYPVVPPEPRRRLEAAAGRFAGVDLVLATHYHDDHFNAEAVARHLRHNPRARFVSTRQAVDQLRRLGDFAQLASRIEGYWPDEGARQTVEHAGIRVDILNLHHGRGRTPEVQNLGFLIDLGGLRFCHVGDTEVDPDDVRPYALDDAGIDVFFAPAWFFTYDSFQPILESVGADFRVVMHIAEPSAPSSWFGPDGSREKRLARIRAVDPEAVILEPMGTRRFRAISD